MDLLWSGVAGPVATFMVRQGPIKLKSSASNRGDRRIYESKDSRP